MMMMMIIIIIVWGIFGGQWNKPLSKCSVYQTQLLPICGKISTLGFSVPTYPPYLPTDLFTWFFVH
jgi:hypothetical protein